METQSPLPQNGQTFQDKWKDLPVSPGYTVSFQLVDDRIILTTPRGNCTNADMEMAFEHRADFLESQGLANERIVEIRDYSQITGQPSKNTRITQTNLLKAQKGKLLSFIVLNASLPIRTVYRIGLMLNTAPYPLHVCMGIDRAHSLARRILAQHSPQALRATQTTEPNEADLAFTFSDFGIRHVIHSPTILVLRPWGYLRSEYAKPLIDYRRNIIQNGWIRGDHFYVVADYSKIVGATWRGRYLYSRGLRDLYKELGTDPVLTFICGAKPLIKLMAQLARHLFRKPFAYVPTVKKALEIIEKNRPDHPVKWKQGWISRLWGRRDTSSGFEEHAQDILTALGAVAWDKESETAPEVPDHHPFKPVFDAIRIVKTDVDDLLAEKQNAQKELERREFWFRTLIENSLSVYTVIDATGKIKYGSPSSLRIFGWVPEEMLGRDVFEQVHPDDTPAARLEFSELLQNPSTPKTMEIRYRHKDGTWRHVDVTGVNRLDDPAVAGIVITSQDATARKQIEKEKRDLQEQLRQSEKLESLGMLAGGIAHDFNNMLGGISGFAELIARKTEDQGSDIVRYAEMITDTAQQASDLNSKLLAFARKGKNQVTSVNIHESVRTVVEILRHSLDPRIHLDQELSANHPVVSGDPSQLQSAILNLALNARDSMPDGGRLSFRTQNLHLDAKYAESLSYRFIPGEYLQLEVKDTGTGIPKEIRERIFEPFFTTKETSKGTGLGLPSVYGTVKGHGGYIHVSSERGLGSTFMIQLPTTEWEASAAQPLEEQDLPMGTGMVLVADDEEIIRKMAMEMLTELGYTAVLCENGMEALEKYRASPASYDLVLLDMIMPVLNGPDCFLRLKETDPSVKVVLFSGYAHVGEAQRLLNSGARAFIPKPFRLKELAKVLNKAMNEQ